MPGCRWACCATSSRSTNTRYTIAARVTGPAETAFPDGPPSAVDAQGKPVEGDPAKALEFAAKAAQIQEDREAADRRDRRGR